MTHELDGTYFVSSTSSYDGLAERKSDGQTEIREGKTERRDSNNVLWTSHFSVLSETEVEMTSIADATDAPLEFYLTKPDGTPTREPVTYKSTLKLARKEDKIQMSGQIEYGNEIIFLTLRKTGA
jgi:hypothetical protein